MIPLYCAENRRAPFVDVFQRSAESHGFKVLLVDPGAAPSALYERFVRAYRHHSVNSEGFELACFKRYFAAQRDMGGVERFIMADSDIVVQAAWGDMPPALHAPLDYVVGSVGYSAAGPEDDTSPHFSRWTPALLSDFIDFFIGQYEQGADELAEIYRRRQAVNPRASISDMTLFALWIRRRGIPFVNSNALTAGHALMDHNISSTWTANGQLRGAWGRKQLVLNAGRWHFVDQAGRQLPAATLHLQGRYKIVAKPIAQHQRGRLLANSAYIGLGRAVRSALNGHARI